MSLSPSQQRPFKLSGKFWVPISSYKKGVRKIDLRYLESCLIDCKNCGLYSCCKYCNVLFFSSVCWRWKYGFKTSAPSTRRSWSMAPVDLKGSCFTPPPHLLHALRVSLSSGRSLWPTKCHPCIPAVIWTITGTGIPRTTRILCPDLRWCDWNQKHRARETPFRVDTCLTCEGFLLYGVHMCFIA